MNISGFITVSVKYMIQVYAFQGVVMKNYISYVLLVLFLFTSCGDSREVVTKEYTPLKIGVLEYNAEINEANIRYLTVGESIVTRSGCYYDDMDTVNINILFEYEGGYCTVTSPDDDIQISRGDKGIIFYQDHMYKWQERTYTFEETIHNTGWLAVNPLGSDRGHTWVYDENIAYYYNKYSEYSVGRECFLVVSAFDFTDGQKIADAKIKIVQHADDAFQDGKSDMFTIELVEYELSDTYKMMLE